MTDASEDTSGVFLAGGHSGRAWDRAREQLTTQPSPGDTEDRLREEMAVRDVLAHYA